MKALSIVVAAICLASPAAQAAGSDLDNFCPTVRSIFQQITAKMSGKDLHTAYINNATAIVKDKNNLRVLLQTQCPKMAKGVETLADKKPALGSDLWKEAVLNILAP